MPFCTNNHPMSAADVFCGSCGSRKLDQAAANSAGTTSSGPSSPVAGFEQLQVAPTIESKSNRNVKIAVGAALVLVVVFLISKGSKPAVHDITYSLSVYDDAGCDLGWGYYNVLGMDVTLEVDGEVQGYESLPTSGYVGGLNSCVFETTFYGIEEGHSSYTFNSPRGDFSYSDSEMTDKDWTVDLSLGLD